LKCSRVNFRNSFIGGTPSWIGKVGFHEATKSTQAAPLDKKDILFLAKRAL